MPDHLHSAPPADRPPLYIFSVPGRIGGASTKVAHLIRLLHESYRITVVLSDAAAYKDKTVKDLTAPFGVPCIMLKHLPKKVDGVALAICEAEFFASGTAAEVKSRGLRLVWSNEMMFTFKKEAEAVAAGLVDRVLFASEFQASAFADIYRGVPSCITGNYIDPDDYIFCKRENSSFTLGRLSRADIAKYPLDFPVFYEELGIPDARYRVMAWSRELQNRYRWHRFGSAWDLLPANKEPAAKFLASLDVFLYTLGPCIKESWGRAVVEAMLIGCIPVVPVGHQFHKLIDSGTTGFICKEYKEFRSIVQELYENFSLRSQISVQCSEHARRDLCDARQHRQIWIQALSF